MALLSGVVALAAPVAAHAQAAWPARPITIVVPFAPGGADAVARLIATQLQERLGQPVVIDNRAGAGGNIGAASVAKAPPDGYTLLFATTSLATNAATAVRLPFDTLKDLAPIGEIASSPLLIVGPGNSQLKSLRELLEFARANPRRVNYGTNGSGSISHIGVELLARQARVEMVPVPYKGTSPATTDLISGQLQAMLASFPTVAQLVQGGQLRMLAVMGAQRSPFAPQVPTLAEEGVSGAEVDFWWGLLGPSGMPPEVLRRLNTELNAVLAQAEMREVLGKQFAVARPGSPEDFRRLIESEVARWTRLVKEANIRLE